MSDNEIVTGQQFAWKLVRKLGEGDAGEVYRVEGLPGGRAAILKRPRLSAFTGEMFRQSAQIRSEAKILKALNGAQGFDARMRVITPQLLDQSKPGAEYNGRNFIVIEPAAGLDLASLARIAQQGSSSAAGDLTELGLENQVLADAVARSGRIPDLILLSVLQRLVYFLEYIHTLQYKENGSQYFGILWNDVKPDHLFWDAQRSALTVIDWGNARFLEVDQATQDRQFSAADDNRQLLEEMNRYLGQAASELRSRLAWPESLQGLALDETLADLKEHLETCLQSETQGAQAARSSEELFLRSEAGQEISLEEIQAIQGQILEYGETPDFDRTLRYTAGFAARLTREDRLDDLRKLCAWAAKLPGANAEHWKLVDLLARIPGRSEGTQRDAFLEAIQNAINFNWEQTLWNVAAALQDFAEPAWWQELTAQIRMLALGPEVSNVRPLVAVRRIQYTLQDLAHQLEERDDDLLARVPGEPSRLEQVTQLLRILTEEVIENWSQVDPPPPDSSLAYHAVETPLEEACALLPERHRALIAVFSQPRFQVKRVLDDWNRKNFVEASRGLKRLLAWDPDRRRVLRAERAILAAPEFLYSVLAGPPLDIHFVDWITATEFRARELRNQVGAAGWLDGILDSCRQIRKGVWPSDLAQTRPELLNEMPWLARFERRTRAAALPLAAEAGAEAQPAAAQSEFIGRLACRLGPGEALTLTGPLDAWVPEARGSSARVAAGRLRLADGSLMPAAVKLMRMDQVHYSLPLFREEATVLKIMRDQPGVAHLIECGFFQLDEGAQFPLISDDNGELATGEALRLGVDQVGEYLEQIEGRIEAGWTPYLAVEQQAREDSLLYACDAGFHHGQYQPLPILLQMAIQICSILEAAHARNIVYRDHKILHYYWKSAENGIYLIDWNVARYHPAGLREEEIAMDIVQFGARGLHHILTGRTAPGALPLGPTRPEEIEQAAHSYQTQWTYDDQRLSAGLRTTLERALAGEYSRIGALRDDLKKALVQLPDNRAAYA